MFPFIFDDRLGYRYKICRDVSVQKWGGCVGCGGGMGEGGGQNQRDLLLVLLDCIIGN